MRARLMLVGEQPGNDEDLEGRPFVGPAGKLLDRCLEEAGIERGDAYVTNVVKHFRYRARGKRRIHQKPDAGHVAAAVHRGLEPEVGAERVERRGRRPQLRRRRRQHQLVGVELEQRVPGGSSGNPLPILFRAA